jgi:hypothetical protein
MASPYQNDMYPFAVDLVGDEPVGEVLGVELSKIAHQFEKTARLFRLIESAEMMMIWPESTRTG